MKSYIRLGCTVCKRTTDQLVDNARVTPDKCIITLRCTGRLVPLAYRSSGEIAVAPQVGLTDWAPRVVTPEATPAFNPAVISLSDTSTGLYQQLVLAVATTTNPAPTSTAQITMSVRADAPKDFRQYTFRFETTFSTVAGVEDGIERKTMRFTAFGSNPDLVEVYLNGVKQESGTAPDQYQIYDGTGSSTVPANIVSFNSAVSFIGTTQVDVIVSKVQASTSKLLTFTRNVDNPSRTTTGAWENVDSLERFIGGSWRRFYLFTYDLRDNLGNYTSDLDINTILVPVGAVSVSLMPGPLAETQPFTNALFLLARKPYTTIDRYPDIAIPLGGMTTERDYLKYHSVGDVPTLDVTTSAALVSYPPARLTKFDPEATIKTVTASNAGVDEQLTIDGLVIVGPDT